MARARTPDRSAPALHRTLFEPGHVPVAHVRLPGAGRLAGSHPVPAAAGGDAHQPGPQLPHLLRAGRRHLLRLLAGVSPLSRDPLGQRLPHRRPRPCHLAPSRAAGADGDHAARPHRLAVAVGDLHALDHGLDRLAARRGARHRPLPGRPARVPRPARHVLGPARHHFARSAGRSAPSTPGHPTASPCSTS